MNTPDPTQVEIVGILPSPWPAAGPVKAMVTVKISNAWGFFGFFVQAGLPFEVADAAAPGIDDKLAHAALDHVVELIGRLGRAVDAARAPLRL